ncbi:2-oxoacid:acceptor oxidoreductase family protein [Tyzzerella sp. OttesenSCG-928-J15]|nr:2-oxoacid:acceptor oxidoreductase family protein [Tyzzerella sp. OttesenSCG-928-J15]
MNNKMIFAGYGGQGMLLCGQLIAYAAMLEDSHVTWFPSYGPEMRGGAASCTVIISDKAIGSPIIQYADAAVVMNQPSFDKFQPSVKPGGVLIYNTSMIEADKARDDIKYIGVPVTDLANDLGNLKVANMIALGSVNEILKCVKTESVIEALKHKFGEKKAGLIEINEKAIAKGMEAAKAGMTV